MMKLLVKVMITMREIITLANYVVSFIMLQYLGLKVVLHWSTCNANLPTPIRNACFSHEFADMLHF